MARCHVLPSLGGIPLAELSPLHEQSYLYEKMDRGLSPNTVVKHYVMLTTALGMAVRLEMLDRSPMDRVTPPKKRETRFSFYTPEQLQQLFSAVQGTMMELPVGMLSSLVRIIPSTKAGSLYGSSASAHGTERKKEDFNDIPRREKTTQRR